MKALIACVTLLLTVDTFARNEPVTTVYIPIQEFRPDSRLPFERIKRVQFFKKKERLTYVFIYEGSGQMPNNGRFDALVFSKKRMLVANTQGINENVQLSRTTFQVSMRNPTAGQRGTPGTLRIDIQDMWFYPTSTPLRPSRDAALHRLNIAAFTQEFHSCFRDFQTTKGNMTIDIARGKNKIDLLCAYR